jgi:hypothetical protein
MGLQLPPGTQVVDGPGTQTYYLLVQNVGSVNGGFDMCYLYHSF